MYNTCNTSHLMSCFPIKGPYARQQGMLLSVSSPLRDRGIPLGKAFPRECAITNSPHAKPLEVGDSDNHRVHCCYGNGNYTHLSF